MVRASDLRSSGRWLDSRSGRVAGVLLFYYIVRRVS